MNRRTFLRAAAAGPTLLGTGSVLNASVAQFGRASGARLDAWVGIHIPNLISNLGLVRSQAGGRPIMAVVKANAYGHGLVPIGRALADAGADGLMVVNTQEASDLREAGIEIPIINFGPMYGFEAEALVEEGIEQVVYTREAISALISAAAMQVKEATVHVHVDTGLGRVGIPYAEAEELLLWIGRRSRVRIAGTSTTLAEDPEFDHVQLQRFLRVCETAEALGADIGRKHVASSAALMSLPEAHLDMVRPGIALYGHYPSEGARVRYSREIDLAPVAALRCRVAQVKQLRSGESVGYHRAYTASADETVATLPVGYSDGYPPEAVPGGASAWIGGTRCPLIGSMSSNHCMALIPSGHRVEPGTTATLIGNGTETTRGERDGVGIQPGGSGEPVPTAHEVATWAGISVYRTHIQLSAALPRRIEGVRRRRF